MSYWATVKALWHKSIDDLTGSKLDNGSPSKSRNTKNNACTVMSIDLADIKKEKYTSPSKEGNPWVSNADNNIVIISSSDPHESFNERDTDESLPYESQYAADLGNCNGNSVDSKSPSQACNITINACRITNRRARERGNVKPGRIQTCHWCRQKTERNHVQCSRCSIKFCDKCLNKQHGENVDQESEPGVKWVCPKCRGGCGSGCKHNCCSCSLCRQPPGPRPAFLSPKEMQCAGFSNFHDYLIHRETGESKEVIAGRKKLRGWTKAGAVTLIKKYTSPSDQLANHNKRNYEDFSKAGELDNPIDKESHIPVNGETRRDPFKVWGDMERNLYLMRLFFNRETTFDGNKLSITLSDKELQQANAIKARSLAKVIANNFDTKELLNRPQQEQLCMRKSLKVAVTNKVNECKMRLAVEIDQAITDELQQLKQDLKIELGRIAKDIERAVDPISTS